MIPFCCPISGIPPSNLRCGLLDWTVAIPNEDQCWNVVVFTTRTSCCFTTSVAEVSSLNPIDVALFCRGPWPNGSSSSSDEPVLNRVASTESKSARDPWANEKYDSCPGTITACWANLVLLTIKIILGNDPISLSNIWYTTIKLELWPPRLNRGCSQWRPVLRCSRVGIWPTQRPKVFLSTLTRFVLDLRPPLNSEEVLPDEFESFHQPDGKHRDVVAEFLANLAH